MTALKPFDSGESAFLLQHDKDSTLQRLAASARHVLTSGVGLLADGYDLLVIDLVISIISNLHPTEMGPQQKSLVVSMTLVGVILGQLSFGAVADIVGRRVASISTATIITAGAILSATCTHSPQFSIAKQLGLARFALGLGIGGEYPISATLGVEGHEGRSSFIGSRTQLQTAICAMFNIGSVLTAVVVLLLIDSGMRLEMVWRVALGCGAVPAALLLFSRLRHTPKEPAAATACSLREVLGPRWPVLLGACLSWGLFNMALYGQSSFRSLIADRIFGQASADVTLSAIVQRNALFSLSASISACVGCMVGLAIVDRIRRFQLQLLGFVGSALALGACGWLLSELPPQMHWPLLMMVYLSTVCYMQVGIATYLIPSESFPSAVRGSCFGVAAAAGKVGAAIGTALFPVCEDAFGLTPVLLACSGVSCIGVAVTLVLTPRVDVDPAELDVVCAPETRAKKG